MIMDNVHPNQKDMSPCQITTPQKTQSKILVNMKTKCFIEAASLTQTGACTYQSEKRIPLARAQIVFRDVKMMYPIVFAVHQTLLPQTAGVWKSIGKMVDMIFVA